MGRLEGKVALVTGQAPYNVLTPYASVDANIKNINGERAMGEAYEEEQKPMPASWNWTISSC